MINKTEMNNFKSGLYAFSGFSQKQIEGNTDIAQIDNCIKRLLDDSKMMKPKNRYNLNERTQMAKINFYATLFRVATYDHSAYRNKLIELSNNI